MRAGYECTKEGTYNAMASMSFAGQEKTIHGFFHSKSCCMQTLFGRARYSLGTVG